MRLLKLFIIGAFIGLFVLVGTPVQAKTLKVGIVSVLSGPGALWGNGILRGAEMAAEEVNARGGLKIKGEEYKIKLIPYDDKYTGKGGRTAVERLVHRDKVKFIIGPISSASALAMQETTENEKVLMLADSWSKKVLGPNKPFTLRAYMTGVEGTPLLVKWLSKAFPEAKSVVTLGPNDASGWSITEDAENAYSKTNIKLASKEFYERKTKDFAPIITRLRKLNPDIVHFTGTPSPDAALVVKLSRESGLKPQFVDATSAAYKKIIQIAGKEFCEGYIWGAFFDPSNPKYVAFEKRYKAKYGESPPTYVDPGFYQASKALFYSMEKAQSLDPATVRDQLKNIPEFESVLGKMEFGGKEVYGIDNQVFSNYYVGQIKNGDKTIIEQLR